MYIRKAELGTLSFFVWEIVQVDFCSGNSSWL